MQKMRRIEGDSIHIVRVSQGGSGGTMDHTKLRNRDAEDQHPIRAITQLMEELSVRPSETMTNTDIQAILNR